MRLQLVIVLCLLAAVLLFCIAGCEETPAAITQQAPRVSVMHPEQRELADHEEFNGWMAADKSVDVRASARSYQNGKLYRRAICEEG